METIDGYAINGREYHWTVKCPNCDEEYEYEGFFDPETIEHCDCGAEFKVRRVWIDDETYI